MNAFRACIVRILILCMFGSGLPLPASAEIVATERAYGVLAERDQMKDFLAREEVRERMGQLGVDAEAARARIDALGDEEVRALASRIEQLPAGGFDALGVLIVVFLVLVITDLLGYTRIFPFTRR